MERPCGWTRATAGSCSRPSESSARLPKSKHVCRNAAARLIGWLMEFRLHPGFDAEAARTEFARDGVAELMPWLADDCAAALQAELIERGDWREVINSGDKVFELDREQQSKLRGDGRARLDAAIDAGARSGFQHRYESIRVPDDRDGRTLHDDLLGTFALFMSSEAVL